MQNRLRLYLDALKKLLADRIIDSSESVAIIVTGFGLNQPDATIDNYAQPTNLSLNVDEFGKYLKS